MPRDTELVGSFEPSLFTRSAYAALVGDGIFSQALSVLTSGTLLVGCALALGASPAYVGLLSAIPFFAQIAQFPAIILIERLRRRKAICIAVTLAARALLLPLTIVPLLHDRGLALALLLLCFAVVTPLGAIGGCAWVSWTSDLVPRPRLGRVFGRRQLYANLAAIIAGLAGAGIVDEWPQLWPTWQLGGYVGVFALAAAMAVLSTWFLARLPDVPMPAPPAQRLAKLLTRPFADRNFRRMMLFLGSWNFAINLAAPFFTVYLVQDLGTGMTLPIMFTIVAQFANVASLHFWGRLSDHLSNKAVIAVCAPALLCAILLWVLAAEPTPGVLTIPMILIAQVMLGAAGAGLDLASGNIAIKAAPRRELTIYLGTNALVRSLLGGAAPLVGGVLAQSLAGLSARITLGSMTIASIRPLTVVFLIACAAGLLALTRLHEVDEPGARGVRLPLLPRRKFWGRAAIPSRDRSP